tara:strand:+ start:7328 stop:7969 length:642 start_codon:yes stop_codon:yes gene_type:complete
MLLPKRQRTHVKLLNITQILILEKGCDSLTLKDICISAEMSVGTIYNYYRNVEDIYVDIEKMMLAAYLDSLNEVVGNIKDPIHKVAISIQQTLSNALPESSFARILFYGKLPHDTLLNGIKKNFVKDMLDEFVIENPSPLLTWIAGGVYEGMQDISNQKLSPDTIKDFTKILLLMLGVSKQKIKTAIEQPFNYHPLPEFPLSASRWLDNIKNT